MLRNLILVLFVLLLGLPAMAQSPQQFKFQAVARNAEGNPYASEQLGVRISILRGSATGFVDYSERHLVATSPFGVFDLAIGAGVPLSGDMEDIDWGSNAYYIKVDIDPAGGTSYLTLGTSQLLSVPYALYARESGSGGGGDPTSQLQNLIYNPDTQTLTITQGNSVSLNIPTGGATQILSFDPSTNELSISDGNTVVLPTGAPGPQGPAGAVGPTGPAGPAGADGATGPAGPQGPAGADGATGPAGPQGPAGADGAPGPEGPMGPEGPQGPAGTGINLLGTVPTVADLPASANAGDLYIVAADGNGYAWDGMGWNNVGAIQGPAGPQGPQGPQGPEGPAGPEGAIGATGPEGPQGPAGADGPAGPQGPEGPQGADGPAGPVGATGPAGPEGPQGPEGPAGTGINLLGTVPTVADLPATANQGDLYIVAADGNGYAWDGMGWNNVGQIQGPAGPEGPAGPIGATGPIGPEGPTGPIGPEGPAGPIGATGPAGPIGPEGPAGPIGATGPAGPIGPEGPAGPIGATGPTGPIGATGPAGPIGPEGPTGPIGATGPAGPIGPEGPAGPIGATGPAGPIGPEGPAGPVGATGPIGPQGPEGPAGPVGATGPVGPMGPEGPVGPQGPEGPAGPAGTYVAGTGINIAGNTISAANTSALWHANRILDRPITSALLFDGDVLAYDANFDDWFPTPGSSFSPWVQTGSDIYYNSGNVGIGSNVNINRRLTITGDARVSFPLYFGNADDNLPHISNLSVGSGRVLWLHSGGTGTNINNVVLQAGTDESSGFRPINNNTVNLGAPSTRWKTIWSNNPLNSSSDQRLKTEITTLNSSLAKVMQMRPVSYRWIEDDGNTHLGFIAQEMEKIVPEVVRPPMELKDHEGNTTISHYAMVYAELIPVLTQAIQEQQALIETQQQQLDAQAAQIEQLEARLLRMERLLEQK
jgi:hypothetical protein